MDSPLIRNLPSLCMDSAIFSSAKQILLQNLRRAQTKTVALAYDVWKLRKGDGKAMNQSSFNNFVQIIGVTDPSQFPIIGPNNPNTQLSVQEILEIPCQKYDVEQINSVQVAATVTETRTILTPIGVKVVIEGILTQTITYTADLRDQPVHTAEFEHPFCTFINIPLAIPDGLTVIEYLELLGLTLEDIVVGPVNVLIEYVDVELVDPRTINKCVILFAYTTISPLLECVCSLALALEETVDIIAPLLGVTVGLDLSICADCSPAGNAIELTLELLNIIGATLTVDASQITSILCSPTTLIVEGVGTLTGTVNALGLPFTITVDTTAGTVTVALTGVPVFGDLTITLALPAGTVIGTCA